MGVGSYWNTESSSKTKICQLDNSFGIEKQVVRLQVSMKYSAAVAEVKSL